MLLRQRAFTVTVKLTSNRTMNTECIARENRRGRHLGQGTIFVYRRGDEMHDLAPVLDWKGLGVCVCVFEHATKSLLVDLSVFIVAF